MMAGARHTFAEHEFRAGDPILFCVDWAAEGGQAPAPPEGTIVRADLKRAVGFDGPPGDDAPVALSLAVQYQPPDEASNPTWVLSAAPAETRTLEPGHYVTDVRWRAGEQVLFSTRPLLIIVTQGVTQ